MKKNISWIYLLISAVIIVFIATVLIRVLTAPNTGPKIKKEEPSIPVVKATPNSEIKSDISNMLNLPNTTDNPTATGSITAQTPDTPDTPETQQVDTSSEASFDNLQSDTAAEQMGNPSEEENSEDYIGETTNTVFPEPLDEGDSTSNDESPRNSFPEPINEEPTQPQPSGEFPTPIN
ncbi:hypothetical membrane protein [Taylorella asinigenitalis 14/45]|uniref:Hypothetical membrane protein n=1 Tax=Taylorella asinigenitalis 14/45 TaxID=1091495 RepID=I7JR12_9BURK|nr:hypothetical protein [Taylorella asinigenitalis]CCG19115.1 hypothetical membrane protein [Taylorella asinigenitalis 14/45]